MVSRLVEGGSAQSSGLQLGDAIVSIDSLQTASWSLDKIKAALRGPEGSYVQVGLRRRDATETLVTLQRMFPGRTGSSRVIQLEAAAPRSFVLGAAPDGWIKAAPSSAQERLEQDLEKCRDEIGRLKAANQELLARANRGDRAFKEAEKMVEAAQVPAKALQDMHTQAHELQAKITQLQQVESMRAAEIQELQVRLQVSEQQKVAAQELLKHEQNKTVYLSKSVADVQSVAAAERSKHQQTLQMEISQLQMRQAHDLQLKAQEYSKLQNAMSAQVEAQVEAMRKRLGEQQQAQQQQQDMGNERYRELHQQVTLFSQRMPVLHLLAACQGPGHLPRSGMMQLNLLACMYNVLVVAAAAMIGTFIGSLKAGFVTERSELGSCRAFRVQYHVLITSEGESLAAAAAVVVVASAQHTCMR